MPPRRFTRGRASRATRLSTRWFGFTSSTSFLAQAAGPLAVAVSTAGGIKNTIMRTRGQLISYIDGAAPPGGLVQMFVGMVVVPEGSGTSVRYDPQDDSNAPWFYYNTFMVGYEEQVTDVVSAQGLTVFRDTIDNKAMRLLQPDEEVQLVVKNVTVGAAESINTVLTGRFLIGE